VTILHTLRLPCRLPSANSLIRGRWGNVNWRARFERELPRLLSSQWQSEIRFVLMKGRKPTFRRRAVPTPNAVPCSILITRIMGPRERPYEGENLWAGIKPLIDALVLAGYLPGDTDAWLTRETPIQRRAENGERAPAIAITIGRRD